MATSVRDDLERDLEYLDLLRRIHGLNERDQMAFQLLQQAERGLTVDDVADQLDCERTTAYHSFSRLHEAGVVVQEQLDHEHGGYCHVYCPRTPEEIAHDMQRLLNDWYADIGQLIHEFEDQCSRSSDDRENQPLQSCP